MHLTEHMIIARSKESDLGTIKRINLWGCDLTDISIVKKMTNIEILALSVNNLSCLQPLEACTKLQELYLRKNNIQDFRQLLHLRNLPSLTNLWLAENPCCARAGHNYRAYVLNMLPNLKKLDDEVVTADDIDKAKKLNCGDLETPEFEDPVAKTPIFDRMPASYCSPLPVDEDAAQHVQHSTPRSNKPNAFAHVLTQESAPYKSESFKYDEAPAAAPIIEQAAMENTQPMSPYASEQLNQVPQHFDNRYSLRLNATARSDGAEMKSMENHTLSEVSRSPSNINHLPTHNLSVNMAQQAGPTDLSEFESIHCHQMVQAPSQYQATQPPQPSPPQSYRTQVPIQSPRHQHQRPPLQHPPAAAYPTQPQQTWTQQDAVVHTTQPTLNQRTPPLSKGIRWPAVSHLDISQATEMDMSLKIPRSYSMQTINEHAEWEEGRRSDICRSLPNPQRYSYAETTRGYCRDNNMNVTTNGSVSACDVEPENWNHGSVTSRTRIVPQNTPNREPDRHDVSVSSRTRLSPSYHRDAIVDDGTQSARTRFSQGTNQDYDGEDDLRSYRTATTLSSQNLRRRNMHVLSALLCIIPELDLESLQVLEHNIISRMDELSSN